MGIHHVKVPLGQISTSGNSGRPQVNTFPSLSALIGGHETQVMEHFRATSAKKKGELFFLTNCYPKIQTDK